MITKFHLSNKQSIKQVHWQRPQIRQIWTVADRRSRAYRRSDHHDLSDRRARLAASYRRAFRRDRVRCHRGPKLGSHLGNQVADHNGSARVLPDGPTRDMRQMRKFSAPRSSRIIISDWSTSRGFEPPVTRGSETRLSIRQQRTHPLFGSCRKGRGMADCTRSDRYDLNSLRALHGTCANCRLFAQRPGWSGAAT